STRSHTEDSIFLRPDEDPVWLDEPAKIEKLGDGVPKNDQPPKCKDGPADGQSPQGEEVFMHKVYALVVQIHCWAAVFVVSQVTVRILGFFHAGRKRASLLHVQGPARHRLLPGLHPTLSPHFWNGRKQQEALMPIDRNLVLLCFSNCFSWFFPSVGGADEGSSEHQTAQLDHPRDSRDGCGHLCHHGKTWDEPSFQTVAFLSQEL
ncbi:unnamed protein product, partial [Tetraodon nigroviridis]